MKAVCSNLSKFEKGYFEFCDVTCRNKSTALEQTFVIRPNQRQPHSLQASSGAPPGLTKIIGSPIALSGTRPSIRAQARQEAVVVEQVMPRPGNEMHDIAVSHHGANFGWQDRAGSIVDLAGHRIVSDQQEIREDEERRDKFGNIGHL
jgi:hypothetical protein